MSNFTHLIENIIIAIESEGYAIIDNAFSPLMIKQLLDDCLNNPHEFKQAAIGRNQTNLFNKQIRKDKTRWLSNNICIQQDYLALMDELRITVNRHFYLGLFDYECHYAKYEQGDFYKKHLDAFQGRSNRIFSTVTYLNTPTSGGDLLIYDKDSDNVIACIKPKAATLVLFESERFPHEVLTAQTPRYSIAGWFRTNNSGGNIVDPAS